MSETPTPPASADPTPTPAPTPPPAGTDPAPAPTPAAETPFYEGWAADLKESPSVLRYKSAEDLARAYVAAEKKLGVPADQLLRAPKGLDDKEGIAAIMKALGAPESPDGYQLDLTGASEGDIAVAKDFAKHMHEAVNAPPAVLKAAVDWWLGKVKETGAADQAAQEAAMKAGETALRAEWGADYDRRVREVGSLMNKYGGPELYAEMERAGVANNPKLMSMFGKLIDQMAEPDRLVGGGEQRGALTPGQAKAKRLELEADPIKAKALNDASNPQHAAVVEERRKLFKLERGMVD